MNVNCYYIVYFTVKLFYPHFRSFETYSCIISYCAAFYLSTFYHDAVRILASPESIAGGALNCKTGEFVKIIRVNMKILQEFGVENRIVF